MRRDCRPQAARCGRDRSTSQIPRPARIPATGRYRSLCHQYLVGLARTRRTQHEWDDAPNRSYDSQAFAKELKATAARPGTSLRAAGDAQAVLEEADRVIQADYSVPHLALASMETTCAVADVQTDNSGRVTNCHILAASRIHKRSRKRSAEPCVCAARMCWST